MFQYPPRRNFSIPDIFRTLLGLHHAHFGSCLVFQFWHRLQISFGLLASPLFGSFDNKLGSAANKSSKFVKISFLSGLQMHAVNLFINITPLAKLPLGVMSTTHLLFCTTFSPRRGGIIL